MKKLALNNQEFQIQLKQFQERLRIQGVSESQVYSKPNLAREFLHFMEQQQKNKPSQISQKIVDQYFTYLKTRPSERMTGGLSVSYLLKHREAVLRFTEFVFKVKKGQSGIRIKLQKAEPKQIEILTEQEVKQMYDTTDFTMLGVRNRAILSLLYGCGLRRKELQTLEVQDIDLSKGIVHLEKTKTKYSRDVPMSEKVQEHIEDYLFNVRAIMLDPRSDLTSFLITERGTAMSNEAIGKMMEKTNKSANVNKNITCHMLRHSIATHLHKNLPLEDVALFLGHKNLDSTMIYTHLKTECYG